MYIIVYYNVKYKFIPSKIYPYITSLAIAECLQVGENTASSGQGSKSYAVIFVMCIFYNRLHSVAFLSQKGEASLENDFYAWAMLTGEYSC